MEKSKLKLNNNKTKVIRFSASSVNTTSQLPHTITLNDTEIVRNFSFFNSNLSMKQHIIKTCKAVYVEIRCMSAIHQYLTKDTTKTLVSVCMLPRVDYCSSLLAGFPQTTIKPLQQVQNPAAKLILKSHRAEHAKLF